MPRVRVRWVAPSFMNIARTRPRASSSARCLSVFPRRSWNCWLRKALVLAAFCFGALNLNAQIRMSGTFAYSSQGNVVTFGVQRIDNFNSIFSISGTLAIQLWATAAPYSGVGTLTGYKGAEVSIGQLQGGFFFSNITRTTTINSPPAGTYNIVFVLAEWNGFQYVTVDS